MKARGQIFGPQGRRKTERIRYSQAANAALEAAGLKKLARSERNEKRNEERREITVLRHNGNEDLLASNGGTSSIPPNPRVNLNGTLRGYETPCAPSPEQLLLHYEREQEIREAIAKVVAVFFANDVEVRRVMIAVMTPPGIRENDNIALSIATNLTVAQIVAAKARMRYKIKTSKNPLVHEIRQILKGGQT